MTQDLQLPISLRMVPTAREISGLALSSRNKYLSPEQKEEATLLYKTLNELAQSYVSNPRDTESLRQNILNSDPSWQYLEVRDSETLERPNKNTSKLVVAGAYFMGDTRLIDNVILRLRE
jgi:pantoate--beta-alanine ligase